jgi:hypothetical protein
MRNIFSELRSSSGRMITKSVTRRLVLGLLLTLCCAGIVLGVHAYNVTRTEARSSSISPPVRTVSRAAAQGEPSNQREPEQVVRFSLYDVGILPREVHVSQGLVVVITEDYWGSAGVVVERESESASQLVGRVDREGPHWRSKSEMRLTPGRYRVYMQERSANRASLVVEP